MRISTAAPEAQDPCAVLATNEITQIMGLPIEPAEPKPDGCDWYANADAQQQKGADTARTTLEKLARRNRSRLRRAESILRGTVDINGAGLPRGKLEPIEGLGDRASTGPMGAFSPVRKGPALIRFGGMGTREQTITLARRIVPRIK